MAITLDSSLAISVDYGHTASGTITIGSGANRVAVVGVQEISANISSVTIGGQAATVRNSYDGGSSTGVSLYYLANPPSGTQPVVVTYVSNYAESVAIAAVFSGVDQATPIVADVGLGSAYTTSPTSVALASALAAGQVAASFIATRTHTEDAFVIGTNATQIAQKSNGSTGAGAALGAMEYYTAAGTSSIGWSWNATNAQKGTAQIAVVLNPASAGSGGATVNLTASNSAETPASSTGAATVTPAGSTATATVTSDVFKGFGGLPLANLTIPNVMLIKLDRTVALSLASQVTNASGQLVITSSALVSGTDYMLVTFNADGTVRGCKKVTAA